MFAALSEALSQESGLASNLNGLPMPTIEPRQAPQRAVHVERQERGTPVLNYNIDAGAQQPSAPAANLSAAVEALADPLKVLLEKETYVRVAKQAAAYAGIKKAELAAAAEEAARAAVEAAKAALEDRPPPQLPEYVPPPLSRRGPAPEALLRAARAGNNYTSADVLGLALGEQAEAADALEPAIKPAADFQYMAQRTMDGLRPATQKGGAGVKTTALEPARAEPVPVQVREGTDVILQNILPERKWRREGWEDYNFCADIPATTPAHKIPLRCVREAFVAAGGQETGLAYPAVAPAASPEFYEKLYMLPTWAEMKIYIQTLAANVRSLDGAIQGRARAALLGGLEEAEVAKSVPGVEVFARAGTGRMLVGRKITERLPVGLGDFVDYAGSADFLAVCRLRPDRPRKVRWRVHSTAGMIVVADRELWDFEVERRDVPGDFRWLAAGTATAEAETVLPPLKDTFVRVLWSAAPEDCAEMLDWDSAAQATPLTGYLTQSPRAPMLRFAVYARERPAPPAGTYANPQFVGSFGSGRRFEEARNPDIFYSLVHGVEIDSRRSVGMKLDSAAAFYSRSFWQCTTPISPVAWRSITCVMRFDQLPTAGKQPMRCVLTAFPFFVYAAYTPAGQGHAQGVYFYVYRLKEGAYAFCHTVSIERSRWYHLALCFKEGIPGTLTLRIQALGGGSVAAGEAIMKIEDDVFYKPLSVEGGGTPHMPMVALGFHKYGAGTPGFTGHVGYVHIFDYTLGATDYKTDLENAWDIKWYN